MPKGRTYRESGQIFGSHEAIVPCLMLARMGASWGELRSRGGPERAGSFVLGCTSGKGQVPRAGLILPLATCRRADVGDAFRSVATYLCGLQEPRNAPDIRAQVQRLLAPFAKVKDTSALESVVEFERTPLLFHLLSENFDYVRAIWDEEGGTASIAETCRFRWRGYGELLEWYHGRSRYPWDHLWPLLVFGDTGAFLDEWYHGWWARQKVARPNLRLGSFFRVRDGVPDAPIEVAFRMGEWGWADLRVHVGDQEVVICCSDTYFDAHQN